MISDVQEKCTTCGYNAGAPNVRTAMREEERQALETRYSEARQQATVSGSLGILDDFESALQTSAAVINAAPQFIFPFLANGSTLYSTYNLSVNGEVRSTASPDDDRHRVGVEGILFGSYGKQIRYAALSLDGSGLTSYGSFAMRLRDVAIRRRASLLEENSYDFVENQGLRPRSKIPSGFRSAWEERHKLAVAKLGGSLLPTTIAGEYQDLLLSSNGNRAEDRFLEVHIFGPFDANSVESVKGRSATKSKGEKADIARIKDALARAGKVWIEE
jgi:hypothetical protein